MDPLCHTLVGASLAEAGLRRTTRLATPALLIGCNLPDVDVVAALVDADTMYGFRRGVTHGVLAIALSPLLLAAGLLLYARVRPDASRGPPLRVGRLVTASYIAVLSHPLLDWLNNYGVRLLMPFDGTWYYGDAIFIVDPWMWLSMASAVVLARGRGRLSLAAWAVLGTSTSILVLAAPAAVAPLPAKLLWAAALLAIAIARASGSARARAPRVARIALGALAIYVAASVAGTALARWQAQSYLAEREIAAERIVAGPLAANPFRRDVIALVAGRYRFLSVDWLARRSVSERERAVPVNDGPLPQRALAAPELAGFVDWLRLPAFELEPHGEGTRVWIQDMRYRTGAAIGRAFADFDASGRRVGASPDR